MRQLRRRRIWRLHADLLTVLDQTHLFAVTENGYVRGRTRHPIGRDEYHRPVVQAGNMDVRRALAGKQIVIELRHPEKIEESAIERIVMIAALGVDASP